LLLNDVSFSKLFKKSENNAVTTQNIVLSILFGFFSSTLVCGLIFKTLHYQGEKIMILYGLVPITLMSLFILFRISKNQASFNMNFLTEGQSYLLLDYLCY